MEVLLKKSHLHHYNQLLIATQPLQKSKELRNLVLMGEHQALVLQIKFKQLMMLNYHKKILKRLTTHILTSLKQALIYKAFSLKTRIICCIIKEKSYVVLFAVFPYGRLQYLVHFKRWKNVQLFW